jgi:hypothetical protein
MRSRVYRCGEEVDKQRIRVVRDTSLRRKEKKRTNLSYIHPIKDIVILRCGNFAICIRETNGLILTNYS